jgi:hypothetical protein
MKKIFLCVTKNILTCILTYKQFTRDDRSTLIAIEKKHRKYVHITKRKIPFHGKGKENNFPVVFFKPRLFKKCYPE